MFGIYLKAYNAKGEICGEMGPFLVTSLHSFENYLEDIQRDDPNVVRVVADIAL